MDNGSNNARQGFFGIIIPKEILDDKELTITEKFIYGYVASFRRCCFESNEAIAEKLGVSASAVKHLIPKLAKKGYLYVEKANNSNNTRRIYSVLDDPKKLAYLAQKGVFKMAKKPVENSASVVQNMHDNEPPVVQNLHHVVQNMHYDKTGVRSAKFAHIDKEEIKNKVKPEQKPNLNNTPAGLAGSGPASRLYMKREDFESDDDYEAEFYKRNTVCLSAAN